jgi:hypothetical protein
MQDEHHEPPEPCFMIEGDWAKDSDEENDERTMGREVPSEKN